MIKIVEENLRSDAEAAVARSDYSGGIIGGERLGHFRGSGNGVIPDVVSVIEVRVFAVVDSVAARNGDDVVGAGGGSGNGDVRAERCAAEASRWQVFADGDARLSKYGTAEDYRIALEFKTVVVISCEQASGGHGKHDGHRQYGGSQILFQVV